MCTLEYHKIVLSAIKHQSTDGICWDNVHGACKDCTVSPRLGYHGKSGMIIIGGCSDPGDITRRECWQLSAKVWEVMEEYPMPKLVRIFSACLAGDGIVVSGGQNSGKPVIQCWLLSTSTGLRVESSTRPKHSSLQTCISVCGRTGVCDWRGGIG